MYRKIGPGRQTRTLQDCVKLPLRLPIAQLRKRKTTIKVISMYKYPRNLSLLQLVQQYTLYLEVQRDHEHDGESSR